jgi:Protein of unknown function (DUF3302)
VKRSISPLARWFALVVAALMAAPCFAASGEFADKVAHVLALFIIIVLPIGGVVLFWLVHILPEKAAEKRHHPQKDAIQVLCLLSLVFGGLLWPLAWLWAYSQPVLYKMAYGVDKVKPAHGEQDTLIPSSQAQEPEVAPSAAETEVVPEPAPRVTRAATRERRPWET